MSVGVDPHAWSLAARAVPEGVRLELGLPNLVDAAIAAAITLTREEARAFARGVLAAAGDATERTLPHPSTREA